MVLIGDAEIDELFGGEIDGWETFYARYPGSQGIMGLSRVGFSADGTQALLYLGNQWHWLAGRGYVWLLSRVGGGWVVERGVMIWIS